MLSVSTICVCCVGETVTIRIIGNSGTPGQNIHGALTFPLFPLRNFRLKYSYQCTNFRHVEHKLQYCYAVSFVPTDHLHFFAKHVSLVKLSEYECDATVLPIHHRYFTLSQRRETIFSLGRQEATSAPRSRRPERKGRDPSEVRGVIGPRSRFYRATLCVARYLLS